MFLAQHSWLSWEQDILRLSVYKYNQLPIYQPQNSPSQPANDISVYVPHASLSPNDNSCCDPRAAVAVTLLVNFGETGLIGLCLSFDDTGALQAEEALFAALNLFGV
jgi:hypothetical protein